MSELTWGFWLATEVGTISVSKLSDSQKNDLAWSIWESLVGVFDHEEHEATAQAEELRDVVLAWLERAASNAQNADQPATGLRGHRDDESAPGARDGVGDE